MPTFFVTVDQGRFFSASDLHQEDDFYFINNSRKHENTENPAVVDCIVPFQLPTGEMTSVSSECFSFSGVNELDASSLAGFTIHLSILMVSTMLFPS